jgi:hypothetical protein
MLLCILESEVRIMEKQETQFAAPPDPSADPEMLAIQLFEIHHALLPMAGMAIASALEEAAQG